MRNKLDRILSIAFKPLFFAWLVALILFVLFRNYSDFIRGTFIVLSFAYGIVIAYAVYSLIRTVCEIMDEEDNY